MIKENKHKVILVLLCLLLISGWFYWFQYRHSEIRSMCEKERNNYLLKATAIKVYLGGDKETAKNMRDRYDLTISRSDIMNHVNSYKDQLSVGDTLYKNCLNKLGLAK